MCCFLNTCCLKMLKYTLCFMVLVCGTYAQTRIVNGTNAMEEEFPYAVSLREDSGHICGGTILNQQFVLTAAHCVCNDSKPENSSLYSIQYGMIEITEELVNTVNVKKINCHQLFNSRIMIYDVAVLELENPIPKGNWAPVTISNKLVTNEVKYGTIIGWGYLFNGGPISKTLQKLNVKIYKTCEKKLNNVHSICVGAPIGGSCDGDSGSPLMVNEVQVGIASYISGNIPCGTANRQHPNVYARISTYYKWIAQIAGL